MVEKNQLTMLLSIETVLSLQCMRSLADIDILPNRAGVYFLVSNSLIDYIGESINIRKRMGTHAKLILLKNYKVYFYSPEFIQAHKIRKNWEKELIKFYKPLLNVTYNNRTFLSCLPDKNAMICLMLRGYKLTINENDGGCYLKIAR